MAPKSSGEYKEEINEKQTNSTRKKKQLNRNKGTGLVEIIMEFELN